MGREETASRPRGGSYSISSEKKLPSVEEYEGGADYIEDTVLGDRGNPARELGSATPSRTQQIPRDALAMRCVQHI